jgi:predicted HTH domain antitoxin
MVSKAVHLSEEEAEGLRQLLAETGESEEEILRRATARGLRDLRLDQAIQAFKDGRSSGEAAKIAGLPRAIFLDTLLDRGVVVIDNSPPLSEQLAGLARLLGDERTTKSEQVLREKPA